MTYHTVPAMRFDGRAAKRAHEALVHGLLVDPGRLAAHSRRVGQLAARLAIALGLDREAASRVGLACTFHDIGKLALPQAVLAVERSLTPAEMTLVRRHAELGCALLLVGDGPLMRLAADVALAHHEAFDGTGYPHGLAGEAIPLAARICCVADTYDALREDRPYRRGLPHAQAVRLIVEGDGRLRPEMFDPRVRAALLAADAGQVFAASADATAAGLDGPTVPAGIGQAEACTAPGGVARADRAQGDTVEAMR